MSDIYIDKRRYVVIDYFPYIADNLSEFGCALFDSNENKNFEFDNLKNHLLLNQLSGGVDMFPLIVYNSKEKSPHTYYTFVNCGSISAFMFFDLVRLACAKYNLKKFYACDYQTNKILVMTPSITFEYGNLCDFKKLLNINEDNFIVGKFLKWVVPPGYSKYYSHIKVFKDDVEKEYYNHYGIYNSEMRNDKLNTDIFYSFEECKDKLNTSENCLEFHKKTILEFDIDDPALSIKAKILKAKNLNIKNITTLDELFCSNLRCDTIFGNKIYAEDIECRCLVAKNIKTNFKNGITFRKNEVEEKG